MRRLGGGPFALWSNLVFCPCFIFMFKPGWPRFACPLPSFLSVPLKESVHSVTANIDLEMRGQQCTFQKVSSQCRPHTQKSYAVFKSICFNSMLEVMRNLFIVLLVQHLTQRFEVGPSSPGTQINLLQKENPKGIVKVTRNAKKYFQYLQWKCYIAVIVKIHPLQSNACLYLLSSK